MSIPALSPAPSLAADPRPLPLSVKLLYGVGEMPITVLMFLSGIFLLFFYKTVMGLPPALAGLGLSASLVLDAVLDPYIGYLSDRARHRLGRRHVFMLPGALAMGVCFFLLFSPPQHLTRPLLFLWLVVCSITLRATSAVYRIPYLGLGAELSRDYDDRTSTMAIRALFGLVGILAAAWLSFRLFFPVAADRLRYPGYPRLGMAFGAIMTGAGLFTFFGTLGYRTSGVPATVAVPPVGVSREAARDTALANLNRVEPLVREAGITLLVEAINNVDMPGYWANTVDAAADLVQTVDRPNVRLQLDQYHAAMAGEDAIDCLRRYFPLIAHVQIADVPGRHEPGTGTQPIEAFLSELDRLAYSGFVGLEYRPLVDTASSLDWMRTMDLRP